MATTLWRSRIAERRHFASWGARRRDLEAADGRAARAVVAWARASASRSGRSRRSGCVTLSRISPVVKDLNSSAAAALRGCLPAVFRCVGFASALVWETFLFPMFPGAFLGCEQTYPQY